MNDSDDMKEIMNHSGRPLDLISEEGEKKEIGQEQLVSKDSFDEKVAYFEAMLDH